MDSKKVIFFDDFSPPIAHSHQAAPKKMAEKGLTKKPRTILRYGYNAGLKAETGITRLLADVQDDIVRVVLFAQTLDDNGDEIVTFHLF